MASHVEDEESEPQNSQDAFNSPELPVIFQCRNCNTILSDSLAFVVANDDLKTVTLNRVSSSVDLSPKLVTSTDGIDQGSTFSPLLCSRCQSVAGKVYKTTPRVLDNLRDAYTFDVNRLSIYQVGSANTTLPSGEEHYGSETGLKAVKETILKLQVLMCTMHQRIANIEQALEIEEGNGPSKSMTDLLGSNLMGIGSAAASGSSSKPTGGSQPNGRIQNGKASGKKVVSADAGRSGRGRERGDGVTQVNQRSGALSRVSADSRLVSDAESSGSDVSTSRGSRREKSSGSSRGGGGARKNRGGVSAQTDSRGRKRTKELREDFEDEDEEEDTRMTLDRGFDKLSPIRKKQNSRSLKS